MAGTRSISKLSQRNKGLSVKATEKYLIVVEKSETGYSAYSPDISGCIATGKTMDKTIANMKSALALHLRAIVEDGEGIPKPRGVQSCLDAERDSAGEDYFITHIAVESILPEGIPI